MKNFIHPSMKICATFGTPHPAPELPELAPDVAIDCQDRRDEPDGLQSIVRCYAFNVIGPLRVLQAFERHQIRVVRYWLEATIEPEFWKAPPDDCVGAVLEEDGTVSLPNVRFCRQIVPAAEPLYITGRPEADTDRGGGRPNLLRAGGVPIVHDRLLAALRGLGAQGQTAPLIYRGSNKQRFDRVQPGYQRFYIQPVHESPEPWEIRFLPASVSGKFGTCGFLRRRNDWERYELGVSRELLDELRSSFRNLELTPVFSRQGPTYFWTVEVDAAIQKLQA